MRRVLVSTALVGALALPSACSPGVTDTPLADAGGAEPYVVAEYSELAEQAGITPAELEDLTQLARQEGVPVEEMIARFAGVSQFSEAVDVMRARIPDGLVHAEWTHGEGLVIVRPGHADAARRALDEAGATAVVVERDRPTEVQWHALAEEAIRALPRDAGVSYATYTDPIEGAVHVEIGAQQPSPEIELALDELRASLGARGIILHVTYGSVISPD